MNSNSGKKRKLLTGTLMILSQILLAGFVLYWLFGQYKEEERYLRKELTSQFVNSQNQVLDSLLMTYVINPVLKNSIKLTVNCDSDSINYLTDDTVEIRTVDVLDNNDSNISRIFAVKISEDSVIKNTTFDTMHFVKGKQEDILKRSVRLIVTGSENIFSGDSFNQLKFPVSQNQSLLKKIFSDELAEQGFSFDLEWSNDDVNDSERLEMSGMFLDTKFADVFPGVNISHYRSHILGLMIPQFLFALLLLGLSAFAFYFTYKSLKKQIMLNTIRNDFVSNITHELKTPVSTIMVALEALKEYDLKENPEVADDYLNMMNDEIVRLDSLISKVMDHTKLESKTELIKKEKTNLNNLIKEAIEKVKLQSGENNINIEFEPKNETVWADIDRIYILGVIFNLLDNSIKYAGKDAQIKIKSEEDKQHVLLTVADNGPGIPEEYLPKLFDTFFRVPKGDKHNVKGYGLGLSYAKLVMTEHSGSVYAENIPGGGCIFTLKFLKSRS